MLLAPWIKIKTNLVVGNNANVAVPHGLHRAPTAVLIVPRATQFVCLGNEPDDTNVYVTGTNAGSACDIYVAGGQVSD